MSENLNNITPYSNKNNKAITDNFIQNRNRALKSKPRGEVPNSTNIMELLYVVDDTIDVIIKNNLKQKCEKLIDVMPQLVSHTTLLYSIIVNLEQIVDEMALSKITNKYFIIDDIVFKLIQTISVLEKQSKVVNSNSLLGYLTSLGNLIQILTSVDNKKYDNILNLKNALELLIGVIQKFKSLKYVSFILIIRTFNNTLSTLFENIQEVVHKYDPEYNTQLIFRAMVKLTFSFLAFQAIIIGVYFLSRHFGKIIKKGIKKMADLISLFLDEFTGIIIKVSLLNLLPSRTNKGPIQDTVDDLIYVTNRLIVVILGLSLLSFMSLKIDKTVIGESMDSISFFIKKIRGIIWKVSLLNLLPSRTNKGPIQDATTDLMIATIGLIGVAFMLQLLTKTEMTDKSAETLIEKLMKNIELFIEEFVDLAKELLFENEKLIKNTILLLLGVAAGLIIFAGSFKIFSMIINANIKDFIKSVIALGVLLFQLIETLAILNLFKKDKLLSYILNVVFVIQALMIIVIEMIALAALAIFAVIPILIGNVALILIFGTLLIALTIMRIFTPKFISKSIWGVTLAIAGIIVTIIELVALSALIAAVGFNILDGIWSIMWIMIKLSLALIVFGLIGYFARGAAKSMFYLAGAVAAMTLIVGLLYVMSLILADRLKLISLTLLMVSVYVLTLGIICTIMLLFTIPIILSLAGFVALIPILLLTTIIAAELYAISWLLEGRFVAVLESLGIILLAVIAFGIICTIVALLTLPLLLSLIGFVTLVLIAVLIASFIGILSLINAESAIKAIDCVAYVIDRLALLLIPAGIAALVAVPLLVVAAALQNMADALNALTKLDVNSFESNITLLMNAIETTVKKVSNTKISLKTLYNMSKLDDFVKMLKKMASNIADIAVLKVPSKWNALGMATDYQIITKEQFQTAVDNVEAMISTINSCANPKQKIKIANEDNFEKVAEVSKSIYTIAKEISEIAALTMPVYDNAGKIIGRRPLTKTEFANATDNVYKIITTIIGALSSKKMRKFMSDDFKLGEGHFKAVLGLGQSLGGMVQGLVAITSGKFPSEIDPKTGKPISYCSFSDLLQNHETLEEDIATILGIYIKALADPNLIKLGNKPLFGESNIEIAGNALKQIEELTPTVIQVIESIKEIQKHLFKGDEHVQVAEKIGNTLGVIISAFVNEDIVKNGEKPLFGIFGNSNIDIANKTINQIKALNPVVLNVINDIIEMDKKLTTIPENNLTSLQSKVQSIFALYVKSLTDIEIDEDDNEEIISGLNKIINFYQNFMQEYSKAPTIYYKSALTAINIITRFYNNLISYDNDNLQKFAISKISNLNTIINFYLGFINRYSTANTINDNSLNAALNTMHSLVNGINSFKDETINNVIRKTYDIRDILNFYEFFVNKTLRLSKANPIHKELEDISKFIDKTNTIDINKLTSLSDVFKNLIKFSQSINGNFEKLADVLSEKLIEVMNQLKEILEETNEVLKSKDEDNSNNNSNTKSSPNIISKLGFDKNESNNNDSNNNEGLQGLKSTIDDIQNILSQMQTMGISISNDSSNPLYVKDSNSWG